mgnify:CR=1 FL=1
MQDYFFVDKNQQQAGPITPQQFGAAGVTAETLVWCQGMAEWTPAGQRPELLPFVSTENFDNTVRSAITTQSTGEEVPTESTRDTTNPVKPLPGIATPDASAEPVSQNAQYATSSAHQGKVKNVPNYLWLAVLSVLFMANPLGIFAVHHAAKVDFNVLQGNTTEALRHSGLAMRWSFIALIISLICFILLVSTFGSTLAAYLSENYEFIW